MFLSFRRCPSLRRLATCALLASAPIVACTETRDAPTPAPSSSVGARSAAALGSAAPGATASASVAPTASARREGRCPSEMVKVADSYCVDRWELSLVNDRGQQLSPYYPVLRGGYASWLENRHKEAEALEAEAPEGHLQLAFPALPEWQSRGAPEPKAVSRPDWVPNSYLSGHVVRAACARAGKRICRHDEWKRACRGEHDTEQPYGPKYEPGNCNIFRDNHPGNLLFGKFTHGHLDPRMNLVSFNGRPLLKKSGATLECKSRWGSDGIFDMVGNLDEWVEAPKGAMAGGFYSRSRRKGCEELITAHPPDYQDYSTGGRCCADLSYDG